MTTGGSSDGNVPGGEVDLSVVVPAHNEERRVGETLRRIFEYLEGRGGLFEVLLVDHGSADETVSMARSVRGSDPRLRVLRMGTNHGKGAAVRAGMLEARGARILFSDADLSTPIEDLASLERALADGADVAFGSRAVPGARVVVRQPIYRETMGKIFNLIVQALVLPGVHDSQCGFKLFRAAAARGVFSRQRLPGFSFDVEILFLARRLGYRSVEVPVSWYNSPDSRVRPLQDSARMLRDLFRIRWNGLRGRY